MRIGVDARLLSRPMAGIARYTHEMCLALAALPDVSLHLFSPAALRYPIPGATVTTRELSLWRNPVMHQCWAQTVLPYEVRRAPLDVFWGPGHRLPPCLPKTLPTVVTIHDLVWKFAGDTMPFLRRLLECSEMPKAVRRAHAIVADSQATATTITEEFPNTSSRLRVIYPGTTTLPAPLPREALATQNIRQPYFLFIGTMEPRKNLIRLLHAYAALPANLREKTTLVIAGGKGWGALSLLQLIATLGIASSVRVLDYVDETMLATLYAHAEFLAMPSLYEGFGFPIIEANSLGTPVLTANNSSMPELIGDAGILVDPHDTASITTGLERLLTDDALHSQLATHAKTNAARFQWTQAAKLLLETMKSLQH